MFTIRYRLFYATTNLRWRFLQLLPISLLHRMWKKAAAREAALRYSVCENYNVDRYDMAADRACMLGRLCRA